MWTRNNHLVVLVLGLSLQVWHVAECVDLSAWAANCSAAPECTCDQSYLSELALATRWLGRETDQARLRPEQTNQATHDDDDDGSTGHRLKTAICMLQPETQLQTLLHSLPADVQVLTILQGRTSGEVSVNGGHLERFHDLAVLDIQGLPPSALPPALATAPAIVLRTDTLRLLPSLHYLNLQHVALAGHPPAGHDSPQTHSVVETHVDNHTLVFLSPDDNQVPLVSYKEYKKEIQREEVVTFAGLSNLLLLRVFACSLRHVTWQMFRGLDKLQHLALERNDLLFVPDFAFYATPHLLSLSLAGNQLLSLQDTALAGLFQLESLDLSANNFSHLSELSLPPFPKLRVANFRSNPVEVVFPSTFEIMNATHVLLLGGEASPLNLLPNSFLGLTALTTLSVTNVRVPVLESQLLNGMSQLTSLSMTGNVQTITFDAFIQVPRLQRLTLSKCNVTTISMDAFYGLNSLIWLDLSSNALTALPPGVFDQQHSLRELLLCNNHLTQLPVDLLTHLPAKMIRLDGNPWHCSCDMRGWQPTAINKVKQVGVSVDNMCHFAYDKGSMCQRSVLAERYVYDKRVEPRCTTPDKYKDWNVFHLMRKQLQCNKLNRKNKLNADEYKRSKQDKLVEKQMEIVGKQDKAVEISTDKKSIKPKHSHGGNTTGNEQPTPEVADKLSLFTHKGNATELLGKKAKQQLELQKELDKKATMKESVKTDKDIFTKTSWKIDMAQKRHEKLKKPQP